MKTLIETKTGRIVNAGDVITLDGTAHILTDFDVPGLVGRGVLSFACTEQCPKKDNTKTTPEVNEADIPAVGTDNDIDDCYRRSFISLFDPKNLSLKMILLDWGMKMGLTTEDEILQYASLIKAATPVGFLGIMLREIADMLNCYDTYQDQQCAFDFANNRISIINPHKMKYPDNVVMFDRYEDLQLALSWCKELVDEICPDGK